MRDRKQFKSYLTIRAALRVLEIAAPAETKTMCLDCGGPRVESSPPFCLHRPDCRGMERVEAIRKVLKGE